jgi:drug/metabolite transporter (DMT)-like permease
MTSHPTPANWASIAALGIIWGGTFMVVSIALQGYGPFTVATARTTLGAITLVLLALILRRTLPFGDRRYWPYIVPIGVLSTALPFFLLSWGQQYVPSAFAGLSMAAMPLVLFPLAHFFAHEPMTLRRSIGVLVGFAGAAILIGAGAFQTNQNSLELWARLACLGAVLSYSVSSITTRRCPSIDPIALSALALCVGSVVLIPMMLVIEGVPEWQTGTSGIAIVFLGLVPTALATLLRVSTIQSAGPVFLSLVNYQVPVWAMVFGASVLGEDLPFRFYLALILILAGLVISQYGAMKRLFYG